MERLPNILSAQYSELLQHCVHPISDGSNLSFKNKTINGKRYWYLHIGVGKTHREHYLGEETTDLLDRIEDEKAAWNSEDDDRDLRRRLVNMLIAGGMTPTPRDEGKILTLLERNGLFLAGAALVGTVAFRAYANMLGVSWNSSIGTQDVDIGMDTVYSLALPRSKKPIHLRQLILDSGLGFVEVPALNPRQPSTSFRIRKRDFIVDVLTPLRGRETSRPVELRDFGTHATPLRYLDYLLEDIQPAVLLYEQGIMINVPAPGRFAVHKCVVSGRRPAAQAAKSRKDLGQAEQVFRALLDFRPADIAIALAAAAERDKKFLGGFESALDRIDSDVAAAVRQAGENG